MEVLETKEETASKQAREQAENEVVGEMQKALSEATKRVEERHEGDSEEGSGEGLDGKVVADVGRHESESPAFSAIKDGRRSSPVLSNGSDRERKVEVTDEEKAAFAKSVVSGGRYVEKVRLLGGALLATFRSRSSIESEAIDALMRRMATEGKLPTSSAFSSALSVCVLAAGVEELNGVRNPTLAEAAKGRENLFSKASEKGVDDPGWMWLYDSWRDRPESVVALLSEAYMEFEAKYWAMIRNASEENFWVAAGSTGK